MTSKILNIFPSKEIVLYILPVMKMIRPFCHIGSSTSNDGVFVEYTQDIWIYEVDIFLYLQIASLTIKFHTQTLPRA